MVKNCLNCFYLNESNGNCLCDSECVDAIKWQERITVADNINHPSHYTFGKIEVIDAIEDWQLPFHLANVVKYVARAGRKDKSKTLEDLKKAQWYLNRYIKVMENDSDKG